MNCWVEKRKEMEYTRGCTYVCLYPRTLEDVLKMGAHPKEYNAFLRSQNITEEAQFVPEDVTYEKCKHGTPALGCNICNGTLAKFSMI